MDTGGKRVKTANWVFRLHIFGTTTNKLFSIANSNFTTKVCTVQLLGEISESVDATFYVDAAQPWSFKVDIMVEHIEFGR